MGSGRPEAQRAERRYLTSNRLLARQLLSMIEGALHAGRARDVAGSI
jgi:hypothetical protein